MHRTLGIERAVIVQPSVYGTDNSVTLAAIKDYGPNCRGVAVVDEEITDDELASMHQAGIRGIRFNLLFSGGVDLEGLEKTAARVSVFGWHVQLLIDGPTLVEIEARLRTLGVPTVIDHMGYVQADEGLEQPAFGALLRLVGGGTTWVKLSGNYRLSKNRPEYQDVIPFARSLIRAAPERMIWGTDWPHPAMTEFMPNDGDLLDALDNYVDSDKQKADILVTNPQVLYGF